MSKDDAVFIICLVYTTYHPGFLRNVFLRWLVLSPVFLSDLLMLSVAWMVLILFALL